MLSSSWQQHRHNEHRRGNLYRSLAQIMLSLASVPLPRIGSWTMDDRGIISLTNRPLSDLTLLYDRHQIPTDIPRVRRPLGQIQMRTFHIIATFLTLYGSRT